MASATGGSGNDAGVTITYTVGPQQAAPTTTVPTAVPQPAVTHQPLPFTGAPVAVEVIGSLALLAAGALTAWSARRGGRRPGLLRRRPSAGAVRAAPGALPPPR